MVEIDKKLKGNENKEAHLAAQPPSRDGDEKLFSDEVFKDNLEFEEDINKLPL